VRPLAPPHKKHVRFMFARCKILLKDTCWPPAVCSASLRGRRVPLISLDPPHFHLLERVRRIGPVRYSSFRDAWKGRGCILVFTTTQASEMGRYQNTPRREGRYQVLADLAPIRTDLPVQEGVSNGPRTFMEREIIRAMVERGLIKATNPDVDPLPKWM
jgi:hypothetical protein